MNDQTSPTADGQGPGSSPWRNPFDPQSAHGLPDRPDRGRPGSGRSLTETLLLWRSDLVAAAVLLVTGTVLGVLAGLAWYRFAPTVWLTIPANAVSQVTTGVDQSSLLQEPEGKGIVSVDGYYFIFTAIAGLLLGILGYFLARRGVFGGRDQQGERDGAAVGAWAGVLLGGFAASTLAAALGRWVSMPDPLSVLHTIAAGHSFHAPVALHAQGLYLAAPMLGLVLFLALTWAFSKNSTPPDVYGRPGQGYFTPDNPYGFPAGAPQSQPQPLPQPLPQRPEQNGQGGGGNGAAPGAGTSAPQADNTTHG
jgi:hypothetical protein